MFLKWIAATLGLVSLGVIVWASDKISYEGERTIYTVDCHHGVWDGGRCTGELAAGERHRFRASRSKQEVLYWIVGSSVPSSKFTECTVKDRGNWSCKALEGQPLTIAHAMADGRPLRGDAGATLPFHAVEKWKWWLLKYHLPFLSRADF